NNDSAEKLLPPGIPELISLEKPIVPQTPPPAIPPLPGVPSPKAQSWGALISIVVIVLMVIIGAFYAWGKRISETNIPASAQVAQ
ncbi:MAG: hypothetical protein KGH56_03865, partial [Patescibacteria group bacterium]|nr:hypothetical protein [Patescibacteria group bacterium]